MADARSYLIKVALLGPGHLGVPTLIPERQDAFRRLECPTSRGELGSCLDRARGGVPVTFPRYPSRLAAGWQPGREGCL